VDAALPEETALRLVEPAAVRGDGTGGETTAVVEEMRRALSILRQAVGDLLPGLGEVNVDTDILLFCKPGTPGETLRGDGVDGVGADGPPGYVGC